MHRELARLPGPNRELFDNTVELLASVGGACPRVCVGCLTVHCKWEVLGMDIVSAGSNKIGIALRSQGEERDEENGRSNERANLRQSFVCLAGLVGERVSCRECGCKWYDRGGKEEIKGSV